MTLLFTYYITQNKDAFIAKVLDVSNKLDINPNWLMAVMYKESRLNHLSINANGGATGLIQFMPATAASLGTTTHCLLNMSNVQQMDYVYKYLKPYSNKINSYVDTYLAVFFPAAIGKPVDWVLSASNLSAATVARYNPSINKNADGFISVASFALYAFKGFTADTIETLKKKIK
ncbi:hypothetical protein FACS1894153_0310 [Bacteroidia bacterium]|nr:hypothetical protein FACS1894153_0310 [Bacteroidia bacterium]